MPKFPNIPDWGILVKFVLTGSFLYSLVVFAPLKFYDAYGWRLLNPQYDVSGVWDVELYRIHELNTGHLKAAGLTAIQPMIDILVENSGQALIRQTPFRTWVQEASGFSDLSNDPKVATWTADVVSTTLPGKISVVFEATPNGGDFSGRDALVVVERNWRGRPLKLEGNAYHVSPHLDIVVKGDIRYVRRTRKQNKRMESNG